MKDLHNDDADDRQKMIDQITSWGDENWYSREDLEQMPTEYLENILYKRKEEA